MAVVVLFLLAWSAEAEAASARRTTCSAAYFDGNPLYGPAKLPDAGPLGAMLRGYRRFAGMSPSAYLRRWYVADTPPPVPPATPGWQYPPLGGYLLTPFDQPVKVVVTVLAGMDVDVFGRETGRYLAPAGTPYADRAIPPQSLDNPSDPATCNYMNFRVLRPFEVQSGPIAPGLGQPGYGYQYVLDAALIRDAPADLNIGYLSKHGYLRRVPPASVS